MKFAGVVLAGGQSKRMGVDKSQLTIGNYTLLQHAKKILSDSELSDIFVSGQQGIRDEFESLGPIGGILTCLSTLKTFEYVFFLPVDMPFVTPDMIKTLKNHVDKPIVHFKNNNLPLMIKNDDNVRRRIKNNIDKNLLSLYQLNEELNGKELESNFNNDQFINTNTPDQWQNAKIKFS
jgi:molybdopterin-guanine dinucleotide biosynthesis protein A